MADRTPPGFGWRAALVAALVVLPALLVTGLLGAVLQARHDLGAAGAALERRADAIAATRAPRDIAEARLLVVRAGIPARLVAPAGDPLVQAGDAAAWNAGDAPWPVALAAAGASGWTALDGWIAAERRIGSGSVLEVRAALPPGTGEVAPATALAIAAVSLLLAGLAGLAAGLLSRRTARRVARAVAGADALAAGRPVITPARDLREPWLGLDAALRRVGARLGELQGETAVDAGGLGAALGPLPLPVAARTPTGGLVRNQALSRLLTGLAPDDAALVEDAVRGGLAGRGAVSRRLGLSGGRFLEVEAWALPGGRVVAVSERTEAERLARLRTALSGSAVRHLRAPAHEIQALGAELFSQAPAPLVPAVQRVVAAADRMDRLVGTLLRGTDQDPAARPPRLEAVGAGGMVWTLAERWEKALVARGLRCEVEVGEDVPAARTDPALAREILDELVQNALRFTPRGGTVTLAAMRSRDDGVVIEVRDTGPGLGPDEVPHARERFYRGRAAEALPGAGLGLGVAGALAERVGARLTVTQGPGGRARLEMPAVRRPAPAMARAAG